MNCIKRKSCLALLAAALLTALAWPVHEAFAHSLADNDCQVCSVSISPELNSDCGSTLLAAPVNFSSIAPEAPLLSGSAPAVPVFYGRAPPAF